MRLRLLKAIISSIFLLLIVPSPVLSATQDRHPLRPFPFELTSEEKSRSISDPYLTPYCAQRPTAVQTNRLDKRDKIISLTVAGDFTSNLSSFITPLLSVTDPDSPHATLSAELKAKGYLADFLEGRAYYEPQAEPQNPNFSGYGLLSRLGVFRELAPETYQDKLKRALIKRAQNDFSLDDNPYGFTPASLTVNNYIIACWNASKNQVVSFQNYDKKNCTSGNPVKLSHFNETNWAPLPKEFATPLEFASASAEWKIKDGGQKNADGKIIEHGKWSQLWPYVPMFSREDTRGWVRSLPEPGQQNDQVIEKPVIHPHLARTYEVSSAFSYLLSPQSTHDYSEDPDLITYWNAPPWTADDNKDWWIDSGHNESQWSLSAGPVCDPNNPVITSSGDLAKEGIIESSVSKTVTGLKNPYDPNCTITTTQISPGVYVTDDSDCYVNQPVRFSPIYLKTFTPFLDEIINNLVSGPRAIFNVFNLYQTAEPKEGPGVGYSDEPSLAYSFTSGEAEAGMKQPGSPAKFFYKGLGYIHCQKERLLATIQPFLTGQPYTPFSEDCDFTALKSITPGLCTGEAFSKLAGMPSQTTSKAKFYFETFILPNLTEEVVSAYVAAEKETGVPCEVIAGIHFREANNSPDQSVLTGTKLGEPEPHHGNRIFHTLEETAIEAAWHLLSKVPEHGNKITDMKTLAKALSRYNGGGNANCKPQYSCDYAKTSPAAYCPAAFEDCCDLACREICAQDYHQTIYDIVYPFSIPPLLCPSRFEGDDDPYVTAWYDSNHLDMYLIYCWDYTQCTPLQFATPGTMPVAIDYYLSH